MRRVVACVVSRGDRLLVCRRPSNKHHGGMWEFPGGKVEPDEADEVAAARELHEELGVLVTSVSPAILEVTDQGTSFVIAFHPTTIEGEPVPTEHSAIRWSYLQELASLDLAPSDKAFVQWMLESGASLTDA